MNVKRPKAEASSEDARFVSSFQDSTADDHYFQVIENSSRITVQCVCRQSIHQLTKTLKAGVSRKTAPSVVLMVATGHDGCAAAATQQKWDSCRWKNRN
jgi:hypothetical protein